MKKFTLKKEFVAIHESAENQYHIYDLELGITDQETNQHTRVNLPLLAHSFKKGVLDRSHFISPHDTDIDCRLNLQGYEPFDKIYGYPVNLDEFNLYEIQQIFKDSIDFVKIVEAFGYDASQYYRSCEMAERASSIFKAAINGTDQEDMYPSCFMMKEEITEKIDWFMIESEGEIFYFPTSHVTSLYLRSVYDIPIEKEVTIVKGYGARFSDEGYLDATEWCVFDTYKEAKDFIDIESDRFCV